MLARLEQKTLLIARLIAIPRPVTKNLLYMSELKCGGTYGELTKLLRQGKEA